MHNAVILEKLKGKDFPLYYLSLFRNVARRQKLKIKKNYYVAASRFQISPSLQRKWNRLFQVKEGDTPALQTYYSRMSRDYLFDVLNSMNVNFANIMHLGVNIEFNRPFEGFSAGTAYIYEIHLRKITHIGKGRAILIFRSQVLTTERALLLTHDDTMLLNNISKADTAKLQNQTEEDQDLIRFYSGLSKLPAELDHATAGFTTQYYLKPKLGMHYGVLSGDLNPFHTERWLSRLFGHSQSFVQGLFTTNLALQYLMSQQKLSLKTISVRLTRPAYVDQTTTFLTRDGHFEFQNAQGSLLATGRYELFR